MIDALYILCLVVLTALMWRARGHRWPGPFGSNFWQRLGWGAYAALAASWALEAWGWQTVVAAVGGYAGAVLGHRSYIAAGIDRGEPIDGKRHESHALIFALLPWKGWSDVRIDAIGLLWTGALRGALLGLPWGLSGVVPLSVGFAAAHLAGYWIAGRVSRPRRFDWIESGEILTGALMGAVLAIAWIG